LNLTSEFNIFAYKELRKRERKRKRERERGREWEKERERQKERKRRRKQSYVDRGVGGGPCNWKSLGLTILQDSAKMFSERGLVRQRDPLAGTRGTAFEYICENIACTCVEEMDAVYRYWRVSFFGEIWFEKLIYKTSPLQENKLNKLAKMAIMQKFVINTHVNISNENLQVRNMIYFIE